MAMKKKIQLKHMDTVRVLKLYNNNPTASNGLNVFERLCELFPERMVLRKLDSLVKKCFLIRNSQRAAWITNKGKEFLQKNAEKLQETS